MKTIYTTLIFLLLIGACFAETGTNGTIESQFTIVTSFESIDANNGTVNTNFAGTDITTGLGNFGNILTQIGLFFDSNFELPPDSNIPVIPSIVPWSGNICGLVNMLFFALIAAAIMVFIYTGYTLTNEGLTEGALAGMGVTAILIILILAIGGGLGVAICALAAGV